LVVSEGDLVVLDEGSVKGKKLGVYIVRQAVLSK